MSMSLEVTLRAAASAYVPLQNWLGTNPFRWFPVQLPENASMPAVTFQRISRMPQSMLGTPIGNLARYRMQLRVYANSATAAEDSRTVANVVVAFMNSFSATVGTQYANQLVLNTEIIEAPETQANYYVQLMDFMIWNREDL